MRDIFGATAETIIDMENKVHQKNDPKGHARRLERILASWPQIIRILDEELPSAQDIVHWLQTLRMPALTADIGVADADVRRAFIGSRDIRDKYLLSSLLWDLGLLYDTSDTLLE